MRTRRLRRSGGLSLLEVLIATMIVGIIAAAVVPMIGDYAAEAKYARAERDFKELTVATQRYGLVHTIGVGFANDPTAGVVPYRLFNAGEEPPGMANPYPGPGDGLDLQLLRETSKDGFVRGYAGPSGLSYSYGPYVMGRVQGGALLLAADMDSVHEDDTKTTSSRSFILEVYGNLVAKVTSKILDNSKIAELNLTAFVNHKNQQTNGWKTWTASFTSDMTSDQLLQEYWTFVHNLAVFDSTKPQSVEPSGVQAADADGRITCKIFLSEDIDEKEMKAAIDENKQVSSKYEVELQESNYLINERLKRNKDVDPYTKDLYENVTEETKKKNKKTLIDELEKKYATLYASALQNFLHACAEVKHKEMNKYQDASAESEKEVSDEEEHEAEVVFQMDETLEHVDVEEEVQEKYGG